MRLALLLSALLLLVRCGTTSGMSDNQLYDGQSGTSLMGSQGGGGVETSIWSDNPNKKTLTNENPQ